MKLLLTSAGISNDSIKKSFFNLVNKKPEDISLAFIPTASNVQLGDKKDWFIKDLIVLKNLNLKSISIVDISAIGRDIWEPQLRQADVLYFEGGNIFHLMEWIKGLNLVDFYFLPHYMSSHFSKRTKDNVLEATKDIKNKIYALDDNSALEIIDKNVKIISEGNFLEIN